jgi:hypothetical protein
MLPEESGRHGSGGTAKDFILRAKISQAGGLSIVQSVRLLEGAFVHSAINRA